jgi:hypothetical protein
MSTYLNMKTYMNAYICIYVWDELNVVETSEEFEV